ncbi:uncharacterized protein B0T23DRAFT_399148 [Neurospora hispaniola]|uniref:Uncharacterized protein n=1 Tax=Neurospora hispaniola TaxID=588809 RepID=A0AAJ0MMV8_9PEZI|nr:hypothetical protein B0T23DRAFT_399148 [Neurospora hispaniola]
MPYAHDLLFSGGLCFAVPLSGMEATLGSHLIAVQHVYGSFGIPLRHSVAVADRHEVSLYTEWEDPFPSEHRLEGHGWYWTGTESGSKVSSPSAYVWVQFRSKLELRLGRGSEGADKPVSQPFPVREQWQEYWKPKDPEDNTWSRVHTNKADSHMYNQQRVYQGVPCLLTCWCIPVEGKLYGATCVLRTLCIHGERTDVITEVAALEAGMEAGVEVENGRKPFLRKRRGEVLLPWRAEGVPGNDLQATFKLQL